MDSTELQQGMAEDDLKEWVISSLKVFEQHLAEIREEVQFVKRSTTGSEMKQLKNTVAETNSCVRLLAADFNTTRAMMLSELRNILHAIARKDEDVLHEQLIAANKEVQKIQQVHTDTQSQLEALQTNFLHAKDALKQAELDMAESNNRQNELQIDLLTTGDELVKAQKQVHSLKCELINSKSQSSSRIKALEKQLSGAESELQQTKKDLESKDIQNELPRGFRKTKEVFEAKEGIRHLKMTEAKLKSIPLPPEYKSKVQQSLLPTGGKRQLDKKKMTWNKSSTEEKLVKINDADTFMKKDEKCASEHEELLKRFKNILDRLTPQNFQELMNQTMQLPINSEERLKGVIDLVFEKATMEPRCSEVYANVCQIIQSIEVKKADGKPLQFRKLISMKFEKQFEREKSDEQVEEQRQRIMALTSEKEKEEALAELEYQQMVVKKQIIGNIRFIGELFKLRLLTEKILENCLFLLLKAKDDESLECFCILATTVGQSLNHIEEKSFMDQFFHHVDIVIKEKYVPSRIRCMLQDLKHLRKNNWTPKRLQTKPVMTDQIKKEAEQERQKKEQDQFTTLIAPRINKNPQESMEKYQQKDRLNTVPEGRGTKQSAIENLSKFKVSKQSYENNDERAQLDPGGRLKSSPCSSEVKVKAQETRSDMFQENMSSSSILPPRVTNKSSSSSLSKRSREKDVDRSTEIQSAIAVTKGFRESQQSWLSELEGDQENRSEPTAPTVSEKEYEKISKTIIEQYLNVKEFQRVTTYLRCLKSCNLQHIFVRVAIEIVLEKNEHMRESIGRLCHRLLDDSTISVEQFKIGLKEVLDVVVVIAEDTPLYWTYLGEIIGGMLAEGTQSFAFLKESVLMVRGQSAEFMAQIMKVGVEYTNEQKMTSVWRASNFTWDMFLPQGSSVEDFLVHNNLTFTEKPVERGSQISPKEETSMRNFQRNLMLLQKLNVDNNAVFDLIEESIPPDLRKTKEFIRTLVSAVCHGVVQGEETNRRDDYILLKNRVAVMKRYIDGDSDAELEVLYEVQDLNNSLENPPGLLRLYFDVLYNECVISKETFYLWRDSQDPNEKNGKDIASNSVADFYKCLEEPE